MIIINKKNPLFQTVIYFIVLHFYNCATIQQMAQFQKPDVSVNNLRIMSISFQDVDLMLDLDVQNPNPLSIPLTAYDYRLKINQNELINGKQDSSITIPGMGRNKISIPFHLTFSELFKTISSLKNRDSTQFNIQCGFSFDIPIIGSVRIPVQKQGMLPIPKLPKISFKSLRLERLGLTGADLKIVLDVKNDNGFDVNLNALNYQFDVSGKSWIKGVSNNMIKISRKGKNQIELPLSVNFLDIGTSAVKILTGDGKLDYQLKGNANIKPALQEMREFELPFDQKGLSVISRQ